MYYLMGTRAYIKNVSKAQVYNTDKDKKGYLDICEFNNKVSNGEVFGFNKNGTSYNEVIDQLFKHASYEYYIYHNIVLIYHNFNVDLYDIDALELGRNDKYTSLEIGYGRVTLYTQLTITAYGYEKIDRGKICNSFCMTREEFHKNYKVLCCKYLLSKGI